MPTPARYVWLLELDVGGAAALLSSEPVTHAGRRYTGTLDGVTLEESIPGVGTLPSERRARIVAAPLRDLAREASEGHDLSIGVGTLSLLDRATGLAEVHIRRGVLRAAEAGGLGETTSYDLSATSYDDASDLIDPRARVTRDDWPTAPERSIGRAYPRVWGQPGAALIGGSLTGIPATSTVVLSEDSGGAILVAIAVGEVETSPVRVWYRADGRWFTTTRAVSTIRLPSGVIVSYIDCTGLSVLRESDERWISWEAGPSTRSTQTARPVLTIGDVLREVSAEAEIQIDRASWAALATSAPYPAGYYVDDSTPAMQVVADIIADTPLAMWSSPSGLAVLAWPYDATAADAVDHLEDGRGVSCVGGLRWTRRADEQAPEVRVSYAEDRTERSDAYVAIVSRDPRLEVVGASATVTARAATGDADTRRSVSVSLPWAYADSSAYWVARWQAYRACVSAREVTVEVDAPRAHALRLGSVVIVTSRRLSLRRAVGVVSGRVLTDTPAWRLTVTLLAPPTTAQQSTGAGASTTAPPIDPPPPQQQ